MSFGFASHIAIENLIYGAFSFSRKGQQVVGRTPGITDEIEKELVEFCNTWGDCRNLKFRRSLNQFPLAARSGRGEKLIGIIKVINSGLDQVGREGTLVRHAVVLTEADYRFLEFNPFALESQGVFQMVWTRQSNCRTIFIDKKSIPPSDLSEIPHSLFDTLYDLLFMLVSGGEMYLFLNNHVNTAEDIIYYIIKLLPLDLRASIALTTFAFRKNLDYKIGCYYRQSSTSPDPLTIQFEKSGTPDSGKEAFLKELFDDLKGEKYGRAIRLLSQPWA